jgi:hypothetical protein
MLCSNCRVEVTEGKQFCGHCGQRLVTATPAVPDFDDEALTRLEGVVVPSPAGKTSEPKLQAGSNQKPCPQCGKKNRAESRFCDGCGTNLVEVQTDKVVAAGSKRSSGRSSEQAVSTPDRHKISAALKQERFRHPAWQAVLFIALDWTIVMSLVNELRNGIDYQIWQQYWFIGLFMGVISCALAGFFMALVLRWIIPALKMKHLWLMMAGWAIGGIGFAFGGTILLGLLIGGLVTALILRQAEPAIITWHIVIMSIGWLFGLFIGSSYTDQLWELVTNQPKFLARDTINPFFLLLMYLSSGMGFGGLGSGVTLWMVWLARHRRIKS